MIQATIPSRNASQIRTHAQKFFIKVQQSTGWSVPTIMEHLHTQPPAYFMRFKGYCKGVVQDPAHKNGHSSGASGQLGPDSPGNGPGGAPELPQRRKTEEDSKNANSGSVDPLPKVFSTAPGTVTATEYTYHSSSISVLTDGVQSVGPSARWQPPPSLVSKLVRENNLLTEKFTQAFADFNQFANLLRATPPLEGGMMATAQWIRLNSLTNELRTHVADTLALHCRSSALVHLLVRQNNVPGRTSGLLPPPLHTPQPPELRPA